MEEEGGWEGGDGRVAVKRGDGAGGGEGGRGEGPPPHCLHPSAPLPFVTERNISLAGRANNGEVCVGGWKRDSGDPPPPSREDQISSPQVRGPEPPRICL